MTMIAVRGSEQLIFASKAKARAQASLLFFTDTFDSSNDAQRILPWAQWDTRDPGRDPNKDRHTRQ